MDLKLQTRQTQTLSQRMIQSAEILQMTAQELNTYINETALENPVMEISDSYAGGRIGNPLNSSSGLIPLMKKTITSTSGRTTMMTTILRIPGTLIRMTARRWKTISGPS